VPRATVVQAGPLSIQPRQTRRGVASNESTPNVAESSAAAIAPNFSRLGLGSGVRIAATVAVAA
jgi:hypothetical protein